jgi:hypothetical protein
VLWRGRFLEGLHIDDAPGWERWATDYGSRLEARFASALSEEGDRELTRGNPGSAVRWFRRAAKVAPYSPGHHRDLVDTLLLLRRMDAARDALERAEREHGENGDDGEGESSHSVRTLSPPV